MPLSTLTNIYFSYFHSVMSYGIIFQETSSHSHSIFSLPWLDFRFYPFLIGLEDLLWESRGIALLLFVYLGTRWGWVVSTTPRPPCPWERPSTHCTGGWVGLGAGLDRCENLDHTGFPSPDLPDRNESLYRLRYLSSSLSIFKLQKKVTRIIVAIGNLDSCRKIFKGLKTLPFYCQYIFSLLLFVIKNNNNFQLTMKFTPFTQDITTNYTSHYYT